MPVAVAQTLTQVFTIGTSNGVDSGAGIELTYDETANTGAINCVQYGVGYMPMTLNCSSLSLGSVFNFSSATSSYVSLQNGGFLAKWAAGAYIATGGTGKTLIVGTTSAGVNLLQVNNSAGTGVVLIDSVGNLSASIVFPFGDNTYSCGTASRRWSVIYAGTGTINTSDAREKTTVTPLTDAELAAAKAFAVEIGTFQFLDAIALKGASVARLHIGFTVQRAIEIMQAQGLDPMRYGFICYDQWGADGDQAAGDRYGFRFDELLLFIARGFDARLTALEAKP